MARLFLGRLKPLLNVLPLLRQNIVQRLKPDKFQTAFFIVKRAAYVKKMAA